MIDEHTLACTTTARVRRGERLSLVSANQHRVAITVEPIA